MLYPQICIKLRSLEMKNNSCSFPCVLKIYCSAAECGLPLQIKTDVEQGWLTLMTCLVCSIRDITALYISTSRGRDILRCIRKVNWERLSESSQMQRIVSAGSRESLRSMPWFSWFSFKKKGSSLQCFP